MFTNLKNKLIEEVKASPSKFQQLAAQAQAAVSSSTNTTPSSASGSESTATTTTTTNENFFSITEEDTPQNTPLRLPLNSSRRSGSLSVNNGTSSTGAIPRTRKLSNSSMASDISFRLPTFPDAPATYHLQSDLESEFGSEFGDDATSGRLEVITKEKLFEAYKRSLERYNKYRCRYTDLVKQYKELERDSTKARAVLIETQEKALRRINELREQCLLEQGAKAHLEQALRVEMDDMKCKIQAYETKLKLLGENPDNIKVKTDYTNTTESLIDLDNDEESKTLNGTAINNESVPLNESVEVAIKTNYAELEQKLHTQEQQVKELTDKLSELAIENEKLKKQEDENALLLAQTKHAIHAELENKESEVKRLNEELKQAQKDIENASKKETQLSGQLDELKEIREKLKQTLSAKQEVDAKLIAAEHMYSTLKEQHATKEKTQNENEEKIKDNELKLQELRQQNGQLNEMLLRYQQNEVSLAEVDNELNRTKNENDNLRVSLQDYEEKLTTAINDLKAYKDIIEKESEIESKKEIEQKTLITKLQAELDNEIAQRISNEKQLKKLEAELQQLQQQNVQSKHDTSVTLQDVRATHQAELSALKEQLNSREKDLKTSGNKVAKHKKQHESQQHKIKEQTDELEKLRDELNKHAEHLQALHAEARVREEQTEIEKSQLKSQITSIVQEISQMEEQMRIVQQSHAELEIEKQRLEAHIENMQRESANVEAKRIIELEKKLEGVEMENSQLIERNVLLEENLNRLEDAHENEMRARLETAENTIQKLNEKMTEVLDENSRMQNAQELMDHDQRSLQDKCDVLEKEKLLIEDARLCLETELERFRTERNDSQRNLEEINIRFTAVTRELAEIQEERGNLLRQIEHLKANENEFDEIRIQLHQMEESNKELLNREAQAMESLKEKSIEVEGLKTAMEEVELKMEELERCRERIALLNSQKASLEDELQSNIAELATKSEAFIKLEEKLTEFEQSNNENVEIKSNENRLKIELEQQTILNGERSTEIEKLREQLSRNNKERTEEHEALKQELTELIELEHRAVEQLEESKAEQTRRIADLESRLQSANADVEQLHENNVAYQVEIEQLNSKHQLEVQELTSTLRRLQDEHGKLQEEISSTNEKATQLNEYEQLKIENEYLNKHVKQLEVQAAHHDEVSLTKSQEGDELKEKLKSLQCELYVLKENAEAHSLLLSTKQSELETNQQAMSALQAELESVNLDLKRQTDHASYVNQQNDTIQKDLLVAQQQLSEMEHKLQAINTERESEKELALDAEKEHEKQLEALKTECERNRITIETLNKEVSELTTELDVKEQQAIASQTQYLEAIEPTAIVATSTNTETAIKTMPSSESDGEQLRELNDVLQKELEQLKHSSKMEIIELQHEIEDLRSSAKESAERIMELERIRAGLQAQKLFSTDIRNGGLLAPETERIVDDSVHVQEKAELESKLKDIMTEVHEVSNRNIFLEQKCENYLILEQSNERLKSQNAKLSRQLDETLVSMQHNEGMNANTEFEYLKNIMFQYLTGNANGNNETLVKVISAVLKFSPQQTQVALEKEHQRRSLINKIL